MTDCFSLARSAQVPADIGRLTRLTALYLTNNELTSLPPAIGDLSALRSLSVDRNLLREGSKRSLLPAFITKHCSRGCTSSHGLKLLIYYLALASARHLL